MRLVLCLVFAALSFAQVEPRPWPHERTDLESQPGVVRGALDNGLRYAYVPAGGEERLRIWLIVLLVVVLVAVRPKWRRKVVDGVRDLINPSASAPPPTSRIHMLSPSSSSRATAPLASSPASTVASSPPPGVGAGSGSAAPSAGVAVSSLAPPSAIGCTGVGATAAAAVAAAGGV